MCVGAIRMHTRPIKSCFSTHRPSFLYGLLSLLAVSTAKRDSREQRCTFRPQVRLHLTRKHWTQSETDTSAIIASFNHSSLVTSLSDSKCTKYPSSITTVQFADGSISTFIWNLTQKYFATMWAAGFAFLSPSTKHSPKCGILYCTVVCLSICHLIHGKI